MSDWRSRALRPLRRDTTGHRGAQAEAPERSMAPRTDGVSAPVEESVVDAGVYVDGKRVYSPAVLSDTFGYLRRTPGAMAWIGLYRPTEAQLQSLAAEFKLHELALEDAIVAHHRPKLERYGDTLFV